MTIVDHDVTALVDFSNPDDEALPLLRCVCGKQYPRWTFILALEGDEMPCCGRQLYWSQVIRVYERTTE